MFTKFISMFLKPKEKVDTTFPEKQIVHYSEPKKVFIPAKQITGILDSDKPYFWNRKGNKKEDYLQLAQESKILYQKWCQGTPISRLTNEPDCKDIAQAYLDELQMVQVYKINDSKYEWVNDGRHRVAAAKELDIHILVKLLGEYL